MKKAVFLFSALLLSSLTMAQVKTPQLSPRTKIDQTVGLTEFSLEYSRPSLRGRDLHKEIIPFGDMWRFGANQNTILTFSTNVDFGGTKVEAGSYAMFATPGEKEWEVILYNDTQNWGVPAKFDKSKVVAKMNAPVTNTASSTETFTISFDNLDVNHFDLVVSWGKVSFPIKITMPTKDLALASIKEVMASGEASERDYYSSANFLLHANEDLDQAVEYINKAIEMNGNAPYYYTYNQALIYKAAGNKEKAIEAANESLKTAKKGKADEYIRKNEALLDELKK